MKLIIALSVVACLAIARGESADTSSVVVLNPDNFDQVVTGAKHVFVKFYAPWCGHCKRLAPAWDELAQTIQADPLLSSRVVIAKVDADQDRSLGDRFKITGFPTLQYFARGKPVNEPTRYSGARTLEAFKEYIEEQVKQDRFARVEVLDPLAAEFLASSDKVDLLSKARDAVKELQDEAASHGALYIHYMNKITEKGSDWVDKELARLQKLSAGAKTSGSKLLEIGTKLSVLSAFKDEASSATA